MLSARGAWLVIEAVPEVVEIKNDTYEGLKDALDDDAVLATNSSSYASSTFVDHVKDPTRFLNLHFAMPPVQNFIEIMGSGQTDQELFDFMLEHMAIYGLQVVSVYKESTGFAINRVWGEVLTVLGEGVSDAEAIDAAFKELTQGTVGPLELLDKMVDEGKLGLKSGEGFYRWENGQPQL
ncbi:3-hydroxyacyl-CoA dehydrogenase family protein [Corynebacterium confusum]|uniref:3-hydroxyacyl-CoA dehydrogenase family protein n=1 Tax=Corynebacterium confusum TaxID=71254 RepID=UPI0025B45807|nr:3-hydroxyacyl-CoA dehydrogenase NAD-binding domain-containing protein [Corynebacterium confusum]WJY88896.1 3-hydroxyadipyl-CoA dehydrogenase [Corynebacterium confusum]